MSNQDPMIEIFIFESQQLLETLEEVLLDGEKAEALNEEQINEVFRIMHTIKGSSSMMSFDGIATLAHAVEDLFSQIREQNARAGDWSDIFDIVLSAADLLKSDIGKIQLGQTPDGESSVVVDRIHHYLEQLSTRAPAENTGESSSEEEDEYTDDSGASFYKIKVNFEPECKMENLRAFGLVNSLTPFCLQITTIPEDLMNNTAAEEIVANGCSMYIQTHENPDELKKIVESVMFLQKSSIIPLTDDSEELPEKFRTKKAAATETATQAKQTADVTAKQNFISVNVNKLDKLMDLVGEIVTTEAMVTKNPEIESLHLESFERASQQLRKLINELQDIVMSVRMVPVSTSFHKMHRIVRDMSKKVAKDVDLVIIGEETEVDKNIIDHLSDPLMHLIRNAVDHGLENADERLAKGKSAKGKIILEARNTGGDVMIIVNDDGRGLDRAGILKKAGEKGLLNKPEQDLSDKEVFAMIFAPGFSTKENVTEFSGRGVGMDVVRRNIDKVGGSIYVDSAQDAGTSVQIRIPLTLAIIEGMKLRVGDLSFIVPMLSIQESFKPDMKDVFLNPDGREMIMIRGECFPILRLHKVFNIASEVESLADGILIMIRTEHDAYCLFVDQLIGEQQAVIKPLPVYIQKHNTGMHGIGGCAVLGDGSISLIIDINNLVMQ